MRDPQLPAPRHAFPLRSLLLAALLVPALAFAGVAWREHVRLHGEAAESVDRTAAIAQEHALKVIETNALILDRIEDTVRGLSWEEIAVREREVHDALRALEARIEQINVLHLIRPDGRLAAISIAYPTPAVDLSDRAYFRRHRAGERGLVFGDPIIGRSTGQPSFTMSRARTAPEGRFDGIVLGSVMPAYFERYWATLAAGADAHFGLVRGDGMLLARMPPPPSLDTRVPPDGALMRAIANGRERGVVVADPALGGSRRLVGFRRVGEHPLYVFYALSLDAVRAQWLRHVAVSGALALLAALVLGAAALVAARRWQAEQRALAELARSAAELRAEIARREAAEEELRAAQRLEAVGRLTGGVAHDFNNLLTAILGSLQLLERHLEHQSEAAVPGPGSASPPPLDARARRLLATARDAVERGSRLTTSLLAFSRRQALRAEPLDANALIGAMLPLLRRALGEAVELRLELGADLPHCMADAAQLEAALLNLVINARDALPPEGGVVTLRTFRAFPAARPGEGQVGIAVSDTGSGMSPEARARAFEPFFTTKPVGKGTGLGLSQVYGVVRQLGGEVTIDSAPGKGTTVVMRLPEASPSDAPATATSPPPAVPAGGNAGGATTAGGRSVLVVEDDPAVRGMAAETFREAGWQVHEASDGRAALALLEDGEPLDLLFTDVVMPGGISGVELAVAARRMRPALAVLLASGYIGEAKAREEDARAAAFPLLDKPYDRTALLAAAAAVLGVPAETVPAAAAASARADATA